MQIDKPWGWERILIQTDKYVMKKIFINPGRRLSLQYHKVKHETVYVLCGTLLLTLLPEAGSKYIKSFELGQDGMFEIRPRDVHRFEATKDAGVLLMEVSTPELDDVVRLEDDYGRV